MCKLLVIHSLLILLSYGVSAQTVVSPDADFIDFSKIKSVLKNDQLDINANGKEVELKKNVQKKEEKITQQYSVPPRSELFDFIAKLWLRENVSLLNWGGEKPDFGIKEYALSYFKERGFPLSNMTIIIVDTSKLAHMALPSDLTRPFFLLSLPFIKLMDLTKLEISTLLLEDYLRLKNGYFESKLTERSLLDLAGKNFQKVKISKEDVSKLLRNYSLIALEKGFTFEEQFSVTHELSDLLKSDLSKWSSYRVLLTKIDELTKSNILFNKYSSIYPSPELQLNWITPKRTK